MNRRAFMNYLRAGGIGSLSTVAGAPDLFGAQSTHPVNTPRARLAIPPDDSKPEFRRISLADYNDHVYGAWLGKIVGAFFGMPFEGKPENVDPSLDRFLKDYTYAPIDDDFYYEMVAIYGFERYGIHMTIEQLGEMWKEYKAGAWGSSEQARLALDKGIKPPKTGEPRYNKWFHTIGPQFSSGTYGMLAAGMVNLAGKVARYYSHINGYAEGCDGAVFVAACTSEAFFETDAEKLVRQAAQIISPESNYRKALDQVLAGYARGETWRKIAVEIENRWRPEYPQFNNAVANGALCALALLYGRGDWLNSINIISAADDYTDADCNSDVVSSIVGAMHGSKAIPEGLVRTLNNRIYGTGMGPLRFGRVIDERISDFAARIGALGRTLLVANGARRENDYMLVPRHSVQRQPLEWFDINDYGQLWNSDWRLAHASRGGAGATYLAWETNTLVTFPRDTRPCRLEREVRIPAGSAKLDLKVGSVSGQPWRLQVLVNNDSVMAQDIESDSASKEPQYRTLEIDLHKYAGQRVTIRLYHWLLDDRPAGSAYWNSAEVRPS
ncbi:MAG TPA: ADP-ribosylglycohydrolase family protein [Terriglobia bacterium]|nr:ADP-ribosylglycohydrolase family protein [Terriglobia bacterium]